MIRWFTSVLCVIGALSVAGCGGASDSGSSDGAGAGSVSTSTGGRGGDSGAGQVVSLGCDVVEGRRHRCVDSQQVNELLAALLELSCANAGGTLLRGQAGQQTCPRNDSIAVCEQPPSRDSSRQLTVYYEGYTRASASEDCDWYEGQLR